MDRRAIIFPSWLQEPYSDALQPVIIKCDIIYRRQTFPVAVVVGFHGNSE